MSEVQVYLMLLVAGALMSAFAQLLLKTAAGREYQSPLRRYINVRVLSAYAILLITTAVSLTAFRVVPLTFAPVADAAAQVFTLGFGVFILKEKLTPRKAAGVLVIAAGIFIIAA